MLSFVSEATDRPHFLCGPGVFERTELPGAMNKLSVDITDSFSVPVVRD
jgi:hypothetical protein